MARGFLALYGAGPSARMRALLGFCSQTSNMGRQLVLQCWASARIPTKASRCADGFGPHGLEEPPGEIDDDGEPGQDLVEGRRTAARSTCCRRWPEQEDQEGAFYRVARVWSKCLQEPAPPPEDEEEEEFHWVGSDAESTVPMGA